MARALRDSDKALDWYGKTGPPRATIATAGCRRSVQVTVTVPFITLRRFGIAKALGFGRRLATGINVAKGTYYLVAEVSGYVKLSE